MKADRLAVKRHSFNHRTGRNSVGVSCVCRGDVVSATFLLPSRQTPLVYHDERIIHFLAQDASKGLHLSPFLDLRRHAIDHEPEMQKAALQIVERLLRHAN